MHISRIELENIKSYASRAFEFSLGTTAITGENGAGKTTIIEAIAWVLFDLLEYKKDDFVKRGEKKGFVRLTLASGLDERQYVVFRDTGTSYHVTDPQLGVRVADRKEEVTRFLWQHLGLEPGTDLRSLFRQAIGVPQGTFTAIFLEGYAERKAAFDRLLKVEEYRQAAEKLRETTRYLDASIAGVREEIARAEGQLVRSDAVNEEHEAIARKIELLTADFGNAETELAKQEARVTELDEKEKRLAGLNSAVERSRSEHEKKQLIRKQAEQAVERSVGAFAKLEAVRAQYEQHLAALLQLTNLEDKRAVRDGLKSELSKIETAIVGVTAEKKRLGAELEKLASAKQRVESLRLSAKEQSAIEKEIDDLRTESAAARSSEERIESIERELARLREKYQTNKLKLTDAEGRLPQQQIAELEQLRDELIDIYRNRKDEIENEGAELTNKKGFLENRRKSLAKLETRLSAAKTQLGRLADPAAEIRVLEKELTREHEIISQIAGVEDKLEAIDADRRRVTDQIADFASFDSEWERISTERNETSAAHRIFLANENEATALESRRTELEKALIEVEQASKAVEAAESELKAAGIEYSTSGHAAERAALRALERRAAEARAAFESTKAREKQLADELGRFVRIRRQLADDRREKERLETVAETTVFIRDTLKEAAPRVAKNYVYRVSVEANQLFREITGDAHRSLRWAEDYSVTLEEGGFERPFVSLSGGEQMAAALSVRLALLKQLSDVRIAFFDEPTTNMDAERRENFAAQIGRVKNFDQLFVVSHDETFDEYVDHHIHVDRDRNI